MRVGAGRGGTYVVPWSDSTLDGQRPAPPGALRAGAIWRWSGEPLRVDGPAGILPLGPFAAGDEPRRRAAARLDAAHPPDGTGNGEPGGAPGFRVTDGRGSWTVGLVATGPGRAPLCVFDGAPPPRDADLWVVGAIVRPGPPADPSAPGAVVCFTPGTLIATAAGPRPVEDIRQGERIQTKDDGCRPVLWTGRRQITGARLHAMPDLAPVRMRAGALGASVPDPGLLVSPDHRIVLGGQRALALFSAPEVLVAARDLIDGRRIFVDRRVRRLSYVHLALERHQIVFANGVETESFHPASAGLRGLAPADRARLLAELPDLAADPAAYGDYARRPLGRGEAAILRAA